MRCKHTAAVAEFRQWAKTRGLDVDHLTDGQIIAAGCKMLVEIRRFSAQIERAGAVIAEVFAGANKALARKKRTR